MKTWTLERERKRETERERERETEEERDREREKKNKKRDQNIYSDRKICKQIGTKRESARNIIKKKIG